jgi:glycosyltransferase involved in cell wall biosynthesis
VLSVTVDARSAQLPRTSGWERYVRALVEELPGKRKDIDIQFRRALIAQRGSAGLLLSHTQIFARRNRLVHFPTYPPAPHVSALLEGRFIYTLHDATWWLYPETASAGGRALYKRWAAAALKRAAAVITVSASAAQDLVSLNLVESSRLHVTPLGTRTLPGARKPECVPDEFLLFVGTLEPRKNLSGLMAALRTIDTEVPPLVIIGRRGWSTVESTHERVVWLPRCSDLELRWLYTHASCVVSASFYEGFGLPVLEALGSGARVACSDIPAHREVGGELPEYFDPNNPNEIAASILQALSKPPPTALAVAELLGMYRWEETARRTLCAYTQAG